MKQLPDNSLGFFVPTVELTVITFAKVPVPFCCLYDRNNVRRKKFVGANLDQLGLVDGQRTR
ncbi:hypothetical protein [Guyparkeria sp. TX1]|uniref:hypothetical protein n=1 Tax=Guyparkeria sp. TX1 TaxID=3115001 RepID=UPI003977A03F